MRPVVLALIAGSAALPAAAQDRPVFIPTRDVAVTYRIAGGEGPAREMRMAWLVADRKLRVDMPGGLGWSVLDQASQRMLVVLDQQRVTMELPTKDGPGGFSLPTEPPASARFTRGGTATVAGLPCTIWSYADGKSKGEACLTADGVMLRSSGTQGSQGGSVEATAVTFGPQDPARFRAPEGYKAMLLPSGGKPPGR